jgi:hypothetical protein
VQSYGAVGPSGLPKRLNHGLALFFGPTVCRKKLGTIRRGKIKNNYSASGEADEKGPRHFPGRGCLGFS